MKALFIVIIILIFPKISVCQRLDYFDVQDTLTQLTCGKQDRELVFSTARKLEAFDTNMIDKNIHYYYYDLGFAYYVQYGFTNDTTLLRKSIQTFEKALFHKSNFQGAIWNIINGYCLLNNCPKSIYYLDRYKKVTPKKKWDRDKDTFSAIEKRCRK